MDLNIVKVENDLSVNNEIYLKTEPLNNSSEFQEETFTFIKNEHKYNEKSEIIETNIKSEVLDIKEQYVYEPLKAGNHYRDLRNITEPTSSEVKYIEEEEKREVTEEKHFLEVVEGKLYASQECVDSNSQNLLSMQGKPKKSRKKNFSCNECGKKFRDNTALNDHLRVHSGERPFKCNICEKSFSQKSTLINHMTIHTERTRDYKNFSCNECGKTFRYQSSFDEHLRTHSGEKPFECNICEKPFSRKGDLNRHMLTHTGEKPFVCDMCNKAFAQKYDLLNHKPIHSKDKPYSCYQCQVCDDSSNQNQLYMQGTPIKLNKKNCKCGETFGYQSLINQHIRVHSGEKSFRCNICEKSYSRKSDLNRHIITHGEKSHKCDVCNKTFTQKTYLINHKLIHSGDEPYSCDQCNKRFRYSGNLAVHKRIHSGEKPYKCYVCGKGFVQHSKLTRHKRIHTKEKSFL